MSKLKDVRLNKVIRVINGRAYKQSELLNDGKYRVLRVGNFFTSNNWYYSDLELDDDKYCDKGDLLYAWSASFGPKIWEEEKVIYHYHIWKMECDENLVLKEYAYHFLNWDKELIIKEHKRGVGMFHLTKDTIENRRFPLPPLPTQKQIVAKLDALFQRIDKSIALLEENIKHTQDLMASVLDEEFGKMVNEPNFKWNEVLTIINGKNQKNVISENGKYPIYGSGGIMAYANDYLCNEGCTIIGRKGTINKPIFVETKFWNVDTAFGISPSNKLLPKYLFYFCMQYNFIKHNKSTTLPSLTKSDLLEINMNLPTIEKQEELVNKISKVEDKHNNLKKQQTEKLNDLKLLKSSLLDMAFKGELVK